MTGRNELLHNTEKEGVGGTDEYVRYAKFSVIKIWTMVKKRGEDQEKYQETLIKREKKK